MATDDKSPDGKSPDGTSASGSAQYVVVARRYRPQGFSELVGQEQVSQALANAIRTSRVGHAYLFTGARGVGKTSTARIFAKALNCQQGPTPQPCGQCDICQSIATGEDVDVMEIDGASNRGIDEIRQLRSNVNVRPSRSRYRIYIVDEVHMLTNPAFNALLKTLEEPPEHVKFIFCTTDPEKIPITVLSRCQRFDFAPVEAAQIRQRLQEIVEAEGARASDEALEVLARRAAGSMRDSQSLLEQLLSFAGSEITLDDVHRLLGTARSGRVDALADCLLRRDAAAALAEVETAVQEGVDAGQLAEQLLTRFRDLLVAAVGGAGELLLQTEPQQYEALAEQGRQTGVDNLLAALQVLDQALVRMRQSTHVRTLLEMALVRICHLETLSELPALVESLRSGLPPAESGPRAAAAAEPAAVAAAESAAATDGGDSSRAAAASSSAASSSAASSSQSSKEAKSPSDAGGAQKKSVEAAHDPSPAATAEPAPAGKSLSWDADGALEIWRQAVDLLEDMTGDFARLAETAAISGPNALVVTFAHRYNLQKEFCERPERKLKIEQALEQVTGQKVVLTCQLQAGEAPAAAAPRRKAVSRRQLVRDAERDPLVLRAAELLQSEVVKVEPLRIDRD